MECAKGSNTQSLQGTTVMGMKKKREVRINTLDALRSDEQMEQGANGSKHIRRTICSHNGSHKAKTEMYTKARATITLCGQNRDQNSVAYLAPSSSAFHKFLTSISHNKLVTIAPSHFCWPRLITLPSCTSLSAQPCFCLVIGLLCRRA